MRRAQKEDKEAGGREREKQRRRAAALAAAAADSEASAATSRQMSREQAQQLLTGVQHRIAKNRSLFEQVRHACWPVPTTVST